MLMDRVTRLLGPARGDSMEHQLAPLLSEIPPTVPIINGDPIYPMESCFLDPNAMAAYSNYSQTTTQPKIYNNWPSCPQYMTQIVFVQVNPGEVLTIKADDGSIQHVQGPADVPLIAPTGSFPPIYLPPGYGSQVVEENGIQKMIIVPPTPDYPMPLPAPVQPLPPFIAPAQFTYPQASQLVYPPVQGEFPVTYIQDPVPQQMPPSAPLPPPPLLPAPATFIYQEHHETYPHGRVNHNQFDERNVKMGDYSKKKLRDRQFGEHKTSSMFSDTPLLPNKAIDMSSTSSTLCAYTVDTAPGTHTDTNNNTSNTCSLNTYTVDDTPKTIADSLPDSNTTDKITSSSDHAPSTSTSNTTFCADIITSAPDPSRISHDSVTSEGTQKSSTPDSTPSCSSESAPISENAHIPSSVNNALRPSGADSISNNTGAYTENDHGKRENNMRGGDDKQISGGKQKKALSSNAALKENSTEHRTQSCCFNIEKPVVSNIQTRSATISWTLNSTEKCDHINSPVTFELAMSSNGKNGIYKNIYNGGEVTVTLQDLQPCTVYFVRVTTIRDAQHRSVSEVVSFTTPGCEPDPPLAPKLISRSKNSLNLQWKGSNDNGSKISSFLLEWDEGKGEEFKSCYSGPMKQHKIFKLTASTKYSFRLAAKNNFGISHFSELAVFYTSGNTPPAPLPPKLKEAGVHSLSLEWCAPTNPNPNDTLTYVLEMEEPRSGLGFKPKYNGEDLSCTVRNLQRNTAYKFRIFAYNLEGRSSPSGEVKYSTCPAKPGHPKKPYVVGAIHARQVKIGWDSPKDNGGMHISSYSLEASENSDGANLWKLIYNGTLQEFLYNNLKPGTTYKLRVFCTSPVGQSQPSDVLTIQTPTLPPESCRPQPSNGKNKCKDTSLPANNRSVNGNLETVVRGKKSRGAQNDRKEYPGSGKKCALGSHAMKCGTVPARHPPSQCGTPVLTCKGPTCVIVSWETPKCNGAEITDYRLQWGQTEDSMHLIYTGPCLRYEVKGLTPATTYFCRVQAVNIVGVGMFGGTGKVATPGTVPAIVPMLQEVEDKVPAKLSSTCIAIQWEEPDCHGSPITGYNIEYGDKKILTVDRVTEYVLKNLQPNTTYRIRIQAMNHYGLSPFSPPIRSKTKPLPPAPPQLACVICGHQSLRLKWGNAPSKKSLANFITYKLLMEDRSGRFTVIYNGPDLTHKVQKLSEYTQYKFKIQACNEAGEGPQSDVYTFATMKTPPAALKAPRFHPLNNNSCEIKWDSLEPVKGDPIVYCLQVMNGKKAEQIYKGPNTTFSFSNYLANSRYRFKVCAGRQYENSDGVQELWGPYSPSAVLSTYKHQSGHGRGSGGKGRGNHNDKDEKYKTEMSDDTFVLTLLIGFALIAILCAVAIQYFLIN
ncbi:fibronectin type III domain containing protein 3C1-like isoform X2 [Peromyscus leucopus]|uniref:fibronectin type III domain containing protein 3C1-like isoform X2 n=1 Tax=Peromyscus leucopus TaxID=10041 RepID=UPI001884FF5A|nr:fibronectin type III domain containing protein 3C1-like isoform X2 [Peromyscus leucopus]